MDGPVRAIIPRNFDEVDQMQRIRELCKLKGKTAGEANNLIAANRDRLSALIAELESK